ncbi:hypothetical protein L596_009629 [Steinernema carpocapsae]|uniref:Uncharacterized protein n=1 Tax=Steinernema carpocapsae TaxID=34508 RepID=A0A4U5PGF2_STECR|nr:hypothetical protein L596_009629 [Steinernema carpocapsae]
MLRIASPSLASIISHTQNPSFSDFLSRSKPSKTCTKASESWPSKLQRRVPLPRRERNSSSTSHKTTPSATLSSLQ